MKIYSEDKTRELTIEELDNTIGKIIYHTEIIHHDAQEYIEEQGHYETIAEYENGGKDVEWVIDVEGQKQVDAFDEEIKYGVFTLYKEEDYEYMNSVNSLYEYKQKLNDTDYLTLKYMEGLINEEDYKIIKETRQSYRDEVNRLQSIIDKNNSFLKK